MTQYWEHVGDGKITTDSGRLIGVFTGDFRYRDRIIVAVNEVGELRDEIASLKAQLNQARKAHLAEREAECLKLRGYLYQISNMSANVTINNTCGEALSTPQSSSYLEQWEKETYGEPVAYINVNDRKLDYAMNTVFHTPTTIDIPPIPLYARKD